MNWDHETLYLAGGTVALLTVASIACWAIRRRAGDSPSPTIDNLIARTNAWWVMVGVFFFNIFIGHWGVTLMFCLISFMALREFVTLTPVKRGDHRTLFWVFFIIVPLQYFFVGIRWWGMFQVLIPVYAFVLVPVRSVLAGDSERFLERTAKIQWGLLVCVFFISHIPMLMAMPIPGYAGENAKLLFFLILVVQISDVLQYVFGKTLGRRKIAPNVSPNKTVEGFVLGVLSASGIGAALWWATPFSPLGAFVMALLLTVMGFLGGLVMSAIKRDLGVKDWGHAIAGHGGFLDRIDSLCFAAPVFFHVSCFYLGTEMSGLEPQWVRSLLKPF